MDKNQQNKNRPRNFDWYSKLNKSKMTPPPWAFPIVWTFLYICILISGFIYIRHTGLRFTMGLAIYILQWILNLIWSPLFFWKKMVRAAMVDVTLMWVSILGTIICFQQQMPLSAYFLYPYLGWVSVAWYLNFYIVRNNRFEEDKVKDGN